MATGKLGREVSLVVIKPDLYRVLGTACREIDDGGEKIRAGEIQVELLLTKAEWLAATGQQILDKMKAKVALLADDEKASDEQKKFKGLAIS